MGIEDTSVEDTAEHIVPEAEVEHLGDADETELISKKKAPKWFIKKVQECRGKSGRSRSRCYWELRNLRKKKEEEAKETAKREAKGKAAAKAAIAKKKEEAAEKEAAKIM